MSASTSESHAASHRRVLAIAAAALLLPGIAPALRVHETSTEFHFTGAVSLGRAIEIKGMIGDVVAEPSSSDEVEVVALKKSPTGDPGRVRLRVIHHEGGTTICAVYPNPNLGGDCTPGEEARGVGAASDVEVSFRVRVPAGVRFVGRTSNGRVAASRLRGDVEAHTVNGNIEIHTSGEARAFTVNGSITAQLDSRAAAASLQTINGNVTVKVSPAAGAQFDATTVNGAIRTSVPIFSTGDSGNHFSGVLGRGGSRLDLRTVNGDIFLQPMHGAQVIHR